MVAKECGRAGECDACLKPVPAGRKRCDACRAPKARAAKCKGCRGLITYFGNRKPLRCVRCRRPARAAASRVTSPAPHSEAHHAAFLDDPARLARIEGYARRAALGLPLFE